MRTAFLACVMAAAAWAADPAAADDYSASAEMLGAVTVSQPSQVRLVTGQSTLLEFPQPIERAAVSNETIADVVVVSPTQLLVSGKQAGSTTLIVWKSGGNEVRTIRVGADVDAFNELLHKLMPDEALLTYQTDHAIILAGTAKHPANVEKAVQAAGAMAEKVVNLVDVADQKQVLLEVRFAEANRSVGRTLGLDYTLQGKDFTKAGFLSGGLTPQTPSTPQFARIDPQDLQLSSTITDLFELRRGTDISLILTALEEKGLIRILAEPNLLTLSGEEASFLAGGEFPIPVVQSAAGTGNNAVTIEFKEFGIRLNFKPVVTGDDAIRMFVEPEVSVLDFGPAAVTIGGFQVPALITRRASTHVYLRSGESLVIGGLISQTDNRTRNQVPVLGSVPVLGQLFRSDRFQKDETELLVLVTPRLTQPAQMNLPVNFPNSEKVRDALGAQMTPPPYPDAGADAVLGAIRPSAVPDGTSAPSR